MLRIDEISMFQFKNYAHRSFRFSHRIICICGKNGSGKTNLLDAIHYLCLTKSYFTGTSASVQQGKSGFRIEGLVTLGDKEEKAVCVLREGPYDLPGKGAGKKEFSINGEFYDKFSQHIGRYPCVIIAPDDAALITGGSEQRRKFLDSLLSQVDPVYLQHLIVYTKIIQQRNALLKSFGETGIKNFSLLDVLDEQLVTPGTYVFDKRKEFCLHFLPAVKHLYHEIAQNAEDIHFVYDSELLKTSMGELLKMTRQKDCFAQRSTAGIHRDDLEINFGSQLFRTIASQGQRKSLLFALKLGEMQVLQKEKGFPPVLLLDDVFEKLDEDRIRNLVKKVCSENEGQVFITDTNAERLSDQLEEIGASYQMINL